LKIRKSSRTEFGKAFGGGVEPYLRGVGHAKTRRDLSLTLFAQDDNVVAQKAEEGFLSRRQERGRKYGAHGGLGMTNRGDERPKALRELTLISGQTARRCGTRRFFMLKKRRGFRLREKAPDAHDFRAEKRLFSARQHQSVGARKNGKRMRGRFESVYINALKIFTACAPAERGAAHFPRGDCSEL